VQPSVVRGTRARGDHSGALRLAAKGNWKQKKKENLVRGCEEEDTVGPKPISKKKHRFGLRQRGRKRKRKASFGRIGPGRGKKKTEGHEKKLATYRKRQPGGTDIKMGEGGKLHECSGTKRDGKHHNRRYPESKHKQ